MSHQQQQQQRRQQRRIVTALPTLAATSQLASLLPKRKPSQKPKPKPKTSTTPQAERPQRCLQVGAPSLLPQTPHSVRKLSTEQRVVRKKSAQFWRSQHLSEGCLEQRLEGAERQREREKRKWGQQAVASKEGGVVGWLEVRKKAQLEIELSRATGSCRLCRCCCSFLPLPRPRPQPLFIFLEIFFAFFRLHLLLLFGAQQPPKRCLGISTLTRKKSQRGK